MITISDKKNESKPNSIVICESKPIYVNSIDRHFENSSVESFDVQDGNAQDSKTSYTPN